MSLRATFKAIRSFSNAIQTSSKYSEVYSKHRQFMPLYDLKPETFQGNFVAPNATLVGEVSVDKNSVIWYGVVIRGDFN